ncbi:MAG: AbrB/MazE/SpoVT family DNA-binding domain-containing protein [Pseudonocardiaceae bacterium]
MRTTLMSKAGRLTVPAEARRALGIDDETELEVEIDHEHDALILRPVVAMRRGDAWAYRPEHRELLTQAHEDSRAGRVRTLSEQDLAAHVEDN